MYTTFTNAQPAKPAALLACMLALMLGSCSQKVAPVISSAPAAATTPVAQPAAVQHPIQETGNAQDGVGAADQYGAEGFISPSLKQMALPTTTGSQTMVRSDGTLTVGNQPFFPMGFYHVSWAGSVDQRMRDLNSIANLGFNTMSATMIYPDSDVPAYGALLKQAQKRGMKLMVEDFDNAAISAFKNDPALLGWMIADDCNNLTTPQQLQQRNVATKALDPNHLTYASMAISYANSHTAHFGKSDAMGNQAYPISGGDDIDMVYGVMSKLVQESKVNNTLPIANLQSFKWENGRYPTRPELYNMTNQALAAGVKGILYYSYLDTSNNLNNQSELLKELKLISGEVKLLSPLFLNGQRQVVNTDDDYVKATMWSLNGRRYLQVLNVSEKYSLKMNLALANTSKLARVVNRPNSLSLKNGTLSGTLTPLSTQWYELL